MEENGFLVKEAKSIPETATGKCSEMEDYFVCLNTKDEQAMKTVEKRLSRPPAFGNFFTTLFWRVSLPWPKINCKTGSLMPPASLLCWFELLQKFLFLVVATTSNMPRSCPTLGHFFDSGCPCWRSRLAFEGEEQYKCNRDDAQEFTVRKERRHSERRMAVKA